MTIADILTDNDDDGSGGDDEDPLGQSERPGLSNSISTSLAAERKRTNVKAGSIRFRWM